MRECGRPIVAIANSRQHRRVVAERRGVVVSHDHRRIGVPFGEHETRQVERRVVGTLRKVIDVAQRAPERVLIPSTETLLGVLLGPAVVGTEEIPGRSDEELTQRGHVDATRDMHLRLRVIVLGRVVVFVEVLGHPDHAKPVGRSKERQEPRIQLEADRVVHLGDLGVGRRRSHLALAKDGRSARLDGSQHRIDLFFEIPAHVVPPLSRRVVRLAWRMLPSETCHPD